MNKQLFLSFLRIGAVTFGGGYAMLPLLENEFVHKMQWISQEEFLDMVSIAESTPGPIAINAATFIGSRLAGFRGALTATVAICIPSFTIIYLISLFFDAFLTVPLVAHAFRGIQLGVIYLIASAGLRMWKRMKKNPWNLLVFTLTALCSLVLSICAVRFSSIFYLLIFGLLGLLTVNLRERRS